MMNKVELEAIFEEATAELRHETRRKKDDYQSLKAMVRIVK